MLRSASRPALWRYLDHLVTRSALDSAGSAVAPEMYTELALVLLDEALRLSPELSTSVATPTSQSQEAAGVRPPRCNSSPSPPP